MRHLHSCFPRHYLAAELNDLEQKMLQRSISQRATQTNDRARIEELERDLSRVAWLARSLAELCLDKGLITKEELAARLTEVDMADGAGDGGLDPKVVLPGESKLADLRPVVPPPRRRRD